MVAFYIVGYGMLTKVNLFDAFIKGAKDGIKVVVEILPTLIGLMVAIAVIRESGVLDWLGAPPQQLLHLVFIFPRSVCLPFLHVPKQYMTPPRVV